MAGKVEGRLKDAGIVLPAAPPPAGNYVPVVVTGKLAVVAGQIAAAAKEQSVGMEQIGQAMSDVAATTTQIASGADQTQHSAKALADLAVRLEHLTDRYILEAGPADDDEDDDVAARVWAAQAPVGG